MRRTKEDAEKTRRVLIDTAIDLFNQNGFAKTRLADIANTAGLTRGAIYHHFKNKEEVFKAIHEEHHDEINKIIEMVLAKNEDPLIALKVVFNKILQKLDSDKSFMIVEELMFKEHLLGTVKSICNVKNEGIDTGLNKIEKALLQAKEMDILDDEVDPKLMARHILFLYIGIFSVRILNPNLIELNSSGIELFEKLIDKIRKNNEVKNA